MVPHHRRLVVLELHERGVPLRQISRLVELSRSTIRKIVRAGPDSGGSPPRRSSLDEHRDGLADLLRHCDGNRVRLLEELEEDGIAISYPALTAYLRRSGIGTTTKPAVGVYEFEPGQEIQHDTSPHQVVIGDKRCKVQTAASVLAFSRKCLVQMFPRFTRFECKIHLTDALQAFEGAPQRVVIDNTSVVVLSGTGPDMVPVPEMAAFGRRFGFEFLAHAIGHADRKARGERIFDYVEGNFLAGRTFADWADLNGQLRAWCERVNARYKPHIRAVPDELHAIEKRHLAPLPAWIPEPLRVHQRLIDSQAYVHLDGNRYSVPEDWAGRPVQVRETRNRLAVDLGDQSVEHDKIIDQKGRWITLDAHRSHRRRRATNAPSPDELAIRKTYPEIADYAAELRRRKRSSRPLKRLLAMARDYPRQPFVAACAEAHTYGLWDLDRLETMVLRRIRSEYFHLETEDEHD